MLLLLCGVGCVVLVSLEITGDDSGAVRYLELSVREVGSTAVCSLQLRRARERFAVIPR